MRSLSISYEELQQIIVRCASAADRLIRHSYPDSPARDYVERSMLNDWGRELIQNGNRELLAQELEYLFRLGTRLKDMVEHVLGYEANPPTQEESLGLPFQPYFMDEEGAFRYIKRLFAYRLLTYKRLNPNHTDAKVIDALPIPTQTIAEFTSYSVTRRALGFAEQEGTLGNESLSSPALRGAPPKLMNWLGTQKQLAELFVKLEEHGWITAPVPEAIKRAFTKSHTIQQVLKPGKSDRSNKRHYPDVFTVEYESMFDGIAKNPKD